MSCCYSGAPVMGVCAFGYYPYISCTQTMEAVSGERMVPLPASLPKEGMGIFIVPKSMWHYTVEGRGVSISTLCSACSSIKQQQGHSLVPVQRLLNHGESRHFPARNDGEMLHALRPHKYLSSELSCSL